MDAETQRAIEEFNRASQQLSQMVNTMSGSMQRASTSVDRMSDSAQGANTALTRFGYSVKDAGSSLVSAASDGGAALQGYNRVLQSTTKVLQQLGSSIPGVGTAIGAIGGTLQTAVSQGDRYAKVYGDLSQNGLLLSDSLSSVADAGRRAGYAIGFSQEQAQKFTEILQRSSGDLALFTKGTRGGRDAFIQAAAGMRDQREALMRLGIGFDEATEGIGQYIRLQAISGNIQNKTAEDISRGTVGYLRNLNELSQLTGQSRAEVAKAREDALRNARFNAKIIELQRQGPEGEAAARRLLNTYNLLAASSKDAADGFADVSTGMVATEKARKFEMATQGQGLKTSQEIINGQKTAVEGFQTMASAAGRTADNTNKLTQAVGNVDSLLDFNDMVKLGAAAAKDNVALEKEIAKRNADTENTAGDARDATIKFQLQQRDLNLKLQDSFDKVIPAAQRAALALQRVAAVLIPGAVEAITKAIRNLERIANIGGAAVDRGRQAGATGAAAGTPAAPTGARTTGAAAPTNKTSNPQLEGLNVKSGAATEATISEKVIAAAKEIQKNIPGAKFASFNDIVKGRRRGGPHESGNAVDIVVPPDQVEYLKEMLGALGAKTIIDEMKGPANPKARAAWAPHVHAEFAMGGIARGPRSGFPALLHGTEAVVPLPDGKSIPVRNDSNTEMVGILKDMKNSFVGIQGTGVNNQMVSLLSDILSVQRNNSDTLAKILQNARA